MNIKLVTLALTAVASCAAALTLVPAGGAGDGDAYSFNVEGSVSEVRVLGRRVTPKFQKIYIEHLFEEDESIRERTFNKTRDEEMNELTSGGYIFLKNEEGVVYEAANAHVVYYHRFPRGEVIEYAFPCGASGRLWVTVKVAGGEFDDLYIGQADEEYLRVGTVTPEAGLNFRLDSGTYGPVAAVLKAGDEFHLTGFRGWCYGEESHDKYVLFYEVIWEGREGWLARSVTGDPETYFDVGDFGGR